MVSGIGLNAMPMLPMEGSLPPDLQGTFFRVGPNPSPTGGQPDDVGRGALHAVELRDGQAVSYLRSDSAGDAGAFWHAGTVLVLPETGLPRCYTRTLEPVEFTGDLSLPVCSHVHRTADGGRVLFSVDDPESESRREAGPDATAQSDDGVALHIGEWDARGVLRAAQSIPLERATWQHDIGVSAEHVVFVESPTQRLAGASGDIPFGWASGADGRIGVTRRSGDGSGVRRIRLDPCLVTHVLGAIDGANGDVELYVCRYDAPVEGQLVDAATPVVGPEGIGLSSIGGNLAVLERWHLSGPSVKRTQIDDRFVEYPTMDAHCDGAAFRYGYCVETRWAEGTGVTPAGILKVDLRRDDVTAWSAGPGRPPTEPVFVRAGDGHSDDEGWLLTVIDDPDRGASDLYVLDASVLGRRPPEAVIHLPERLPFRSHGEWVPASQYR